MQFPLRRTVRHSPNIQCSSGLRTSAPVKKPGTLVIVRQWSVLPCSSLLARAPHFCDLRTCPSLRENLPSAGRGIASQERSSPERHAAFPPERTSLGRVQQQALHGAALPAPANRSRPRRASLSMTTRPSPNPVSRRRASIKPSASWTTTRSANPATSSASPSAGKRVPHFMASLFLIPSHDVPQARHLPL